MRREEDRRALLAGARILEDLIRSILVEVEIAGASLDIERTAVAELIEHLEEEAGLLRRMAG